MITAFWEGFTSPTLSVASFFVFILCCLTLRAVMKGILDKK